MKSFQIVNRITRLVIIGGLWLTTAFQTSLANPQEQSGRSITRINPGAKRAEIAPLKGVAKIPPLKGARGMFENAVTSTKAGNTPPASHSKEGNLRAASAGGLKVEYSSLDESGFPEIVSHVFVRNEATNAFELGLTQDNFEVYENDLRQLPILVEELTQNIGSLSVALLMDRSGSIRDELDDAKKAASSFVNLLDDSSQAAIISFGTDVIIEQTFTHDKDSLLNAIAGINSGGRTALYDAVFEALDLLENTPGKKAIIVLSDGRDRSSAATLEEALARLREADARVFSIGLGLAGDEGEAELRALADASGGAYLDSPTTAELEKAFRTLFSLLTDHQGYLVSYTTGNCVKDGALRNVRMVAKHEAHSGEGTRSYLAPGASVDLAITADSLASPGQDFRIRIETPEQGADIYAVTKLQFTLTYETGFLQVKTPHNENVIRGNLLQSSPSDAFEATVDEAAGRIHFTYQRSDPGIPLTGKGGIAEVVFEASIDMPDSTALPFAIINLSTDDGSGCEAAITPRDFLTHSYGLIVWPGDTNANGTVELTDVLLLGVYWEMSGPARAETRNRLAWQPQLAGPFAIRTATHADTDGAGDITERDIIPIGLNWGKTQADGAAKSKAFHENLPDGGVDFQIVATATTNRYRLFAAFSPASRTELAGVTFRARYPADRFKIISVEIGDAWLDQPLSFSKIDAAAQQIAVGLIVPAGSEMPVDGGELVEIVFETRGDAPAITDFSFEEFGLVAADGSINEKSIITGIDDDDASFAPTEFLLSPAYPNPFNPSTTLQYVLPAAANVRVRIFNAAGRLVYESAHSGQSAGVHKFQWQALDNAGKRVSSGVYLVSLAAISRGETFKMSRKVVLTR